MKSWIITAIVGAVSFAAGCVAGYFVRERSEVKFEEVTEAELEEFARKDMEKRGQKKAEEAPEKEEKKEDQGSETPAPSPLQQIDTQKTAYWNYWKDDGATLSTGGDEEDEMPVISEEELTEESLIIGDGLDEERLPRVEESDEIEYEHWSNTQDGEYDAVEVMWFAGDNVCTDEDGDPIENHRRYLGFDPAQAFAKEGITGDQTGTIYRKNNLYRTVYQVTRYPSSYGKLRYEEEFGGYESS